MVSGEHSFESVLAAARTKEEIAWRRLYESLAPALLGYLRGRGAADAEGLLGETFLQLVRDLPQFDGDWDGFRAWAFTIAHHRLLDERRRLARRPEDAVGEPPPGLEDPAVDVEHEALARLGLSWVADVLANLSEDQRDVVLLRIVGELSIEQVARVLGKRPGAVKQLQRRGLAAIRRQLEREAAQR